jgi:hypothetical protein
MRTDGQTRPLQNAFMSCKDIYKVFGTTVYTKQLRNKSHIRAGWCCIEMAKHSLHLKVKLKILVKACVDRMRIERNLRQKVTQKHLLRPKKKKFKKKNKEHCAAIHVYDFGRFRL